MQLFIVLYLTNHPWTRDRKHQNFVLINVCLLLQSLAKFCLNDAAILSVSVEDKIGLSRLLILVSVVLLNTIKFWCLRECSDLGKL